MSVHSGLRRARAGAGGAPVERWGGPGLSMEQRGGGEGARAQGAPTCKRCGLVGRWHSTDAPRSWKERTVVGGPGDPGLSVRKGSSLSQPGSRLTGLWSLSVCVGGLSLTLRPPAPRSESWDLGQTHPRPGMAPGSRTPNPRRGWGDAGVCVP